MKYQFYGYYYPNYVFSRYRKLSFAGSPDRTSIIAVVQAFFHLFGLAPPLHGIRNADKSQIFRHRDMPFASITAIAIEIFARHVVIVHKRIDYANCKIPITPFIRQLHNLVIFIAMDCLAPQISLIDSSGIP